MAWIGVDYWKRHRAAICRLMIFYIGMAIAANAEEANYERCPTCKTRI